MSLDGDSNTFNNIWKSPDVVIPTSRRRKYYVGTQELLRGDVGKRGKGGDGIGTGDGIAWNWGPEGTSGESVCEDSKKGKRAKVTFGKSEKVKVKR